MTALQIVQSYYQHFNNKNWQGMLDLLHPDIKHETNQGDTRVGKQLFTAFLAHMEQCYDEQLNDLVFFSEPNNERVAVEFVVHGAYISTDTELPEAKGQKYVLPVGAFLDVKEGKITRVTTYYNLPLWMKMVAG
jgi:steroid delta-isomerase-like uncharacterized protein